MSAEEVGPFQIGSHVHPGAAKIVEEAGEVMQLIGKLMAFPNGDYPDGTDVLAELTDELGDLKAAIDYFCEHAEIENKVATRRHAKIMRFRGWHASVRRDGVSRYRAVRS